VIKAETLKPQDVLVACRLFSLADPRRDWSYSSLSEAVKISAGEAHRSVERLRRALVLLPSGEVSRRHLRDLLGVACPRVYYSTRGGIERGTPTSVHAPVLRGKFDVAANALPVVWPGRGDVRGESLLPIYPTAPDAAAGDEVLYELLALADVLRVGTPADVSRATACLDERILGLGRGARSAK
jgi:hypothetical protein